MELQIIQDYENQIPIHKILKKYYIGYKTLYKILKQNNILKRILIPSKRSTKFKLNENYFEKIDTEGKAYFLGLMYADGNISSAYDGNKINWSGRIQINLAEEDGYILEEFKREIEYTGLLRRLDGCKKDLDGYDHKPTAILNIGSKKMHSDLIKLGCVPNKSLILKFPTKEQVSEHLMHHFIRGLFDGDGCIFFTKHANWKKQANFTITGTKDVCLGVQREFLKFLNTPERKITTDKTAFKYRIGGNRVLRLIYEYLYKNANFYLKRKYLKFLEFEPTLKTSKYKNVYFAKKEKKWIPFAVIDKKKIHIGRFFTEEEAYQALCKWKIENNIKD